MKVILKEDISNLGYKDDVVEVKSGYGRNYLIPQGKAVIATESALKILAENQRQRAHKLAKIKADAEAAAAALEGVKLSIGAKTSSTGTSSALSTLSRSLKLSKSSVTMSTARSSRSRKPSRKWANTPPPSSSTRKLLLRFLLKWLPNKHCLSQAILR